MTEWKEINSQKDIDKLLDTYGGFHDSCIVSVNYKSGTFVDDKNAMHGGEPSDFELFVVFHSQWEPQTLEMCFIGLRQIHLTGWQENYFGEIVGAYLSFHKGLLPGNPDRVIVWADDCDFHIQEIDNAIHEPSGTYIVANALKWRLL